MKSLQCPETRITQLGDVNGTEGTGGILTYFGDKVFFKNLDINTNFHFRWCGRLNNGPIMMFTF